MDGRQQLNCMAMVIDHLKNSPVSYLNRKINNDNVSRETLIVRI
jgi:hypothetical protein